MFHIALYEPQIAPNTGNIIRLAANNGCHLHLIEPLGFSMEQKQLRRAGLDYHDLANISRHSDYQHFSQAVSNHRIFAITSKGNVHYHQVQYQANDVFLFGSETMGLPEAVKRSMDPDYLIRIPMQPGSRCINLANAVAIITYEAWRQHEFKVP